MSEQSGTAGGRSRGAIIGGAIAVVAALLGIITAIITIYQTISDDGPPAFKGDITTASDSRDFRALIRDNDGTVIYLDVECSPAGAADTTCAHEGEVEGESLEETFSKGITDDGSSYTLLMVTEDETCQIRKMTSCRDAYWIGILAHPSVEANVRNFGGNIAVKGYFAVTVMGNGNLPSGGPPWINYIQLRAVSGADAHRAGD